MVVLLTWSSCSHGCPMLRGCGLPHPHCRMVTFVALLQQVLQALRADRSCVAMQRGGGDTGCPGGVLVVAHPHPPSHARTLLSRLCPLVPTYPLAPSPSLSRPPPSPSRTLPHLCGASAGHGAGPAMEVLGHTCSLVLRALVPVPVVGSCGAWGLCGAGRGHVGSGACEAALVGRHGVTRPGDVAAKSMVMRWVGDA
jgi:hypothetical protein